MGTAWAGGWIGATGPGGAIGSWSSAGIAIVIHHLSMKHYSMMIPPVVVVVVVVVG